jgi:ABC-type glycerol-3-phosphate transport system substrate-binding protein
VQRLRLLLLPVLLISVFGLAACGGGESDEDKITSTIETAATSTDPAVCGETQTLSFMEATAGGSGKEAEKECEEETKAGENNPESVTVSKVNVEDEKATANVAFEGGTFNGQTLEVALVKEGSDWKLNEFTGFAKFDSTQLVKVLAKKLEEDPKIEPQVAGCIAEGLEELPEAELETLVVENNTQPIVELAESCE